MTADVLVALDGSPGSEAALEYALETYADGSIVVLYVIDPFEANHDGPLPPLLGYWGEWYEDEKQHAANVLDAAADRAASRDIDLSTVLEHGRASREIVEHAVTDGVDHVVIGPHSRPRGARVLLGNTADRVLRRSPVPVTVVR